MIPILRLIGWMIIEALILAGLMALPVVALFLLY
jgi:hypothetical protein